jgi:HlyD family secretion protein
VPTTTHDIRNSKRSERRHAFPWWSVPAGLLVLGGIVAWSVRAHEEKPDSSRSASSLADGERIDTVPRVDVVRPTKGGIPRVSVQPGSVHAYESVDLYAMVSGYLKSQVVDIGSKVKKGEVLAEIGVPRESRAADEAAAIVEQSRAQLRQAEARVQATIAEKLTVAATVAQTKADVERSVSRRVLTESQFMRVKELHDRNAVAQRLVDESRQERDAAIAAERVAHLVVETAEAQLAAAAAKIEQVRADVAEAKAALSVSEASLAKARVDLDYARIVAPFDGTITHRGFYPGAFIRSASAGGEVPLLTVVRTDLMRVIVRIPDRDVVLANPGDPAEVSIDAIAGKSFRGVVSRIGESEDPTTRTMRVEIDLPNPNGLLRAGMYGCASIGLDSHSSGLKVPVTSVVDRSGKGDGSVRVVRDGRIHRQTVELGADDGSSVEVVSGLAPDDEVVLKAGTALEEGMPVVVDVGG